MPQSGAVDVGASCCAVRENRSEEAKCLACENS
jgi:hypothetical protein